MSFFPYPEELERRDKEREQRILGNLEWLEENVLSPEDERADFDLGGEA